MSEQQNICGSVDHPICSNRSGIVHKDYHKAVVKALQTQLAHQAALLREALEVVESIIGARESVCMMGPLAFIPVYREAQALIPKIREALKP